MKTRRPDKNEFADFDENRFELVEDSPDVGFYLYVYRGDPCLADHLQSTKEKIKELALEDYGVPQSSWIEAEKVNHAQRKDLLH